MVAIWCGMGEGGIVRTASNNRSRRWLFRLQQQWLAVAPIFDYLSTIFFRTNRFTSCCTVVKQNNMSYIWICSVFPSSRKLTKIPYYRQLIFTSILSKANNLLIDIQYLACFYFFFIRVYKLRKFRVLCLSIFGTFY